LGKGRELDVLVIFFWEKKLRILLGLKVGEQSLIWKSSGQPKLLRGEVITALSNTVSYKGGSERLQPDGSYVFTNPRHVPEDSLLTELLPLQCPKAVRKILSL